MSELEKRADDQPAEENMVSEEPESANVDTAKSPTGNQDDTNLVKPTELEDRFHAEPKDLEIDVPKTNLPDDFEIGTTPSKTSDPKAKKKRKSMLNVVPDYMKEQWKKPFEIGWGREIVYRNTSHDGRRTGDVYYFSPEGRKLRSKVEVEKHLMDTSSDIPMDCFTFRKEPVYKEPFEIIRNAKEARNSPSVKSSPKLNLTNIGNSTNTPNENKVKKKINKNLTKKIKKHLDTTSVESAQVIKITSPLVTVSSSNMSLLDKNSDSFPSFESKSMGTAFQSNKPKKLAVAKKHTGKRKPSVLHVNGTEKRQKVANGTVKQKLCDFSCGSSPPSVSCEVCLCLFHPHCVGHLGGIEKFICQGCRTTDENPMKGGVISVVPGINPSKVVNPLPGGVMSTTRIIAPQSLLNHISSPRITATVLSPQVVNQNSPLVMGASTSSNASPGSLFSGSKFSSPTQTTPIRLNISTGSVTPNQVSGQLITLPPHVTNKLNLQKPLNLKLNGQTFNIPPSCFIATADGVKVLLPPGSLPENVAKGGAGNPLAMSTSSTATSQQLSVQSMVNNDSSSPDKQKEKVVDLTDDLQKNQETLTSDKEISADKDNVDHQEKLKANSKSKSKKTDSTKVLCHFRKLHAGFDCMIHIFQYLPTPDLLRVQQVCQTWHSVASQNYLWKTMRLRNLQIIDWESAASCVELHKVQIMDLRGMVHPNNDPNRTWHQFHSVLGKLGSLKQIEFSKCPSSVLHAVSEKLSNLKLCTAESIVESSNDNMSNNAKLDLGKFSQLKQLECLKLRGSQGLQLPTFAFSGGLVELGNLKELKTLALTTLRDVAAQDFQFLGSLINLQIVELGDCTLWTDETYKQLENLTKLTSLRLEAGGDLNNESLGKSLLCIKGLKNLELINFVVSESLGKSLSELKTLESFSVWPNTDVQHYTLKILHRNCHLDKFHSQLCQLAAKLNSYLLDATKEMTSLKLLEWGVMNENGDPGEGVPLLSTVPDEEDQEKVELVPQQVSINELIQRLSDHLPDTKIRVFKVPPTLIRRVCPPKRVQTPPTEEMET